MTHDTFTELLDLATEILQLENDETSLSKSDWKAAQKHYRTLVEQFNAKLSKYVDNLLVKDADWSLVAPEMEAHLDAMQASAEAEWLPPLQYIRERLLPQLTQEAARPPFLRLIRKWTPWAIGATILVGYLSVRLLSGVAITAPLETKLGIQQRAEATEKVLRYDEWMNVRVQRGGWIKGIFLWPIAPTTSEIDGAGEFVSLAFEGYDALLSAKRVCYAIPLGSQNTLSDDQIALIEVVSAFAMNKSTQWTEPPVLTLLVPIEATYKCKEQAT